MPLAHLLLKRVAMKVAESDEAPPADEKAPQFIRFPLGLLGFEDIKDFVLLSNPGEEPFAWLQVASNPSLAFLVVPPGAVIPDYRPDISAEDTDFLQLHEPEEALILNIVTTRGTLNATLNLKGPIVLNRHTLMGKQVIPVNAADYPVQHPLTSTAG